MFIHSAQVCGEELKTQPLPAGTVSTTLLLLRQQNQLLLLLRQLPHSSVPEWERTAPLQLRAAERYISELILKFSDSMLRSWLQSAWSRMSIFGRAHLQRVNEKKGIERNRGISPPRDLADLLH